MEVEEVVKCGSLYVPPQGFLKQKKSWHKKYYVLYKSSRQGIQRLEVFDNEDQYVKQQNCIRILALSDCLKVAPSPQKQQSNVFEVRTKESTHLLSADTFNEMTEWLNCLQMVAFGANHIHNNSIPIQNLSIDSNANQFNNKSNALNNLSDFQSEENLLYSSVDAPDVYRVKLIDTETSIRCGLRSGFDCNHSLIVTSVNISLAEEGKVMFVWPYRHIRRYGCTKEGFSLEAGRKCSSGEGLFSFITKDGNSIFQGVATHVNSLKASQHISDDQILNAINISPKLLSKEMGFLKNKSNMNIEPKPPSLPSTSPPLSSSYTSKSTYLATNSSLLPSTKIPETSKRHSIQPPKSPQMITKQSVTRVTSISSTNSVICTTDSKPKVSPPISKPPRKSKDSKTSDSEEPLFASRQEIFGVNGFTNDLNNSTNNDLKNEEVLYDEPGELNIQANISNEEQQNKSHLCPSPPPVNHTVSKLTSVLKMMFSGSVQNQINSKSKRVSARSSTGSSGNTSVVSSPVRISAPEKIGSEDLNYAQILDSHMSDKNKSTTDVNSDSDSNHYSKILNDSTDSIGSLPEHQYANVRHQDLDESIILNKITDNLNENNSQTEHYVQNDCEYARVVKRGIHNTSL